MTNEVSHLALTVDGTTVVAKTTFAKIVFVNIVNVGKMSAKGTKDRKFANDSYCFG